MVEKQKIYLKINTSMCMYYRNISFLFFLFMLRGILNAQEPLFELGLWKQESMNGSLIFEGLYRSQETIFQTGKTERPITKKLSGQFNLKSRSYIWHPNFWKINIDIDYNPGVQDEKFLVIPNRSETRTAEQLRLRSVFFHQRPLSLDVFFNINHHFINREYTSNVESLNRDYGGGISFQNALAPVSIHYIKSDWVQEELQTGREFFNKRENIRVEINKSFIPGDLHRFTYSYDDYNRKYGSGSEVHNLINSWRLQNNIPLNTARNSFWHSFVFFRHETGNQKLDRLQINENLTFALPLSFKFSGLYRYAGYSQIFQKSKQHNITACLEHQLFLSLHSKASYDYIDINHFAYNEYTNQGEVSFDYVKGIPIGRLSMGYTYRKRNDNRQSGTLNYNIMREKYILDDSEIVLIENPYVDPLSVIVRDEGGSIIYDLNLDYILIQQGHYIEIQRLPGGQITNKQPVYLDYIVQRSLSYNFDTNSQVFSAGLMLLDRWINLYFRYHEQTYDNVIKAEEKILKTIYQQVYGIRISKSFFTVGFEYDEYKSNITPYLNKRYYFTLSDNIYKVLNISMSGNWRERLLFTDFEKQQFADITGRLIYFLGINSRISIDGGYRFQEGRGIDLDLSNIRAEYSMRLRSVLLSIGLEIYRRNFSGEIINYQGGYVKVERKF